MRILPVYILLIATTLIMGVRLDAKLVFENDRITDTVAPDANTYDFSFPFKNEGDTPVLITDIKTSCGCTVAKLEKRLYQAGESGEIKGSFSIGSRQGKHTNTIRVLTDTQGYPEISLNVEVNIPYWVKLKPGMLLWRVGDELVAKDIIITPNNELGVTNVSVECDSKQFEVKLMEDKEKDGSWRVRVTPLDLSQEIRVLIRIRTAIKDKQEPKVFYAHIMVRGNPQAVSNGSVEGK